MCKIEFYETKQIILPAIFWVHPICIVSINIYQNGKMIFSWNKHPSSTMWLFVWLLNILVKVVHIWISIALFQRNPILILAWHVKYQFHSAKFSDVDNFKWSLQVMPKQPGFEKRRDLYMLYHYLNHYNLFGSGYRSSAMSIIDDYLAFLKA